MATWTKTLDDPVRHDRIRIEVLDQHGNLIGELAPHSTPTIEADVSAAIPRRLTGLALDPTDTTGLNPYSDRLRPVWRVGDTDYNLGVFLWSMAGYVREGWGLELTGGTAHDQTFVLTQPLPKSYGINASVRIDTSLADLVEAAGIWDHSIAPTTLTTSAPLAWPVGTPRTEAIDALTDKLGYVWWFDNDGTFRAEPTKDADIDAPDHWYEEGDVDPGVPESDDLWQRPNTWLVVSTASNASPIVATYELANTHPASAASRGFQVVEVIEEPGITSTAQAEQRARDAARQAQTSREITLSTTPNPAHDLHQLVAWRGVTYREVGWSLPLEIGSSMSHRLRRTDDAD